MENKKELTDRKRALLSILSYIIISFFGVYLVEITILLITYIFTGDLKFYANNAEANKMLSVIINMICYILLLISTIFFGRKFFKEDFIDLKKYWHFYLLGAILIFIAIYISQAISSLFYEAIHISSESENQNSIETMITGNLLRYIISAPIIAIVGPIVEEYIFRKCLFKAINIDWLSIIVSGLLFGLIHVISGGDYIMSIPYILSGVMFAVGYKLCNKNIYPTIVAHIAINSIAILVTLIIG